MDIDFRNPGLGNELRTPPACPRACSLQQTSELCRLRLALLFRVASNWHLTNRVDSDEGAAICADLRHGSPQTIGAFPMDFGPRDPASLDPAIGKAFAGACIRDNGRKASAANHACSKNQVRGTSSRCLGRLSRRNQTQGIVRLPLTLPSLLAASARDLSGSTKPFFRQREHVRPAVSAKNKNPPTSHVEPVWRTAERSCLELRAARGHPTGCASIAVRRRSTAIQPTSIPGERVDGPKSVGPGS